VFPDLANFSRLPSSVFSKTNTGQALPVSGTKSQHTPSNVMMFGYCRIEGCPNMWTSERSAMKTSDSELCLNQGLATRLNARLALRLTYASWTIPVLPAPRPSRAGFQVMGRKSMLDAWAVARNAIRSYSVSEGLVSNAIDLEGIPKL
jgi:hypothetical protein